MNTIRKMMPAVLVLLIAVLAAVGVSAQPPASVRNVIFMIGDGMGFAHVEAGRLAKGGPLNMDSAPLKGEVATDALDGMTTDSAAAATALATGERTVLYHVGVSRDEKPLPLISEMAKAAGKSVGIVTSARITHATPAGFSAHVCDRDMEEEIAAAQIESGFDLFFGGGATEFLPTLWSKKPALVDMAKEKGYSVIRTRDQLLAAERLPLLGLFEFSHMNYHAERDPEVEPTLAEMTAKALQLLSGNANGFFLMVEGARIDHLGHDNRIDILGEEVLAFDEAVGTAIQFAANHPGTLVVVVADHETGGLKVNSDGTLEYSTTDHTNQKVPLFVFGEGAQEFSAVEHLTDIPRIAARLAGLRIGPVSEAVKLKVMTYNMHIGVGIDLVRDLDRIAGLIQAHGVDVVGLNEVDKGTRRSAGVDQAKYIAEKLGWNYYFGDNWSYDGGRYGNALLTPHPITTAENHLLPNPRGGETRGLLHAVVDIDGVSLNVFVTHLDAQHQDVRIPQSEAITAITSGIDGPKVLMGDFNAIPMLSSEISTILSRFGDTYSTYKMLTDSKVAIEDGFFHRDYLKGGYTYSADDPNRRIDYIFTSFDIKILGEPGSAYVPKTPASDHLPYVAAIEVDPNRSFAELEPRQGDLAGETVDILAGKRVGLVVTQSNQEWYQDFRWDFGWEMELAETLLKKLGVEVARISDPASQLELGASGLDVVVLPNTRRLSESQLEAIREYERGGGRILAFAQSSLELLGVGYSRGDFELKDTFGVHFVGWQGVAPLHSGIRVGDKVYRLGRNQAVLVSPLEGASVLGTWVNEDGSPSHDDEFNAAVVKMGGSLYVGETLFAEENAKLPEVQELLQRLLIELMSS